MSLVEFFAKWFSVPLKNNDLGWRRLDIRPIPSATFPECIELCPSSSAKMVAGDAGLVGVEPSHSSGAGQARPPSGGSSQDFLLVLLQVVHVEIADGLEPVLVCLHRQRPHQPEAAFGAGEDAHHLGAPLDLLV